MKVEPGTSNAVIVAHQFNPSVVNQLWLVDNGIVARDEFQEGCVFSDMVVNVNAKEFSLFISPEQLQFVPRVDDSAAGELVTNVLGKFVQSVPHTPFAGLGLNFVWIVSDDDIPGLNRRIFYRPEEKLFQAFDNSNSRFGAYMSRDFNGGRLKLDIKPVTMKLRATGESIERLQFAFNFDFGIEAGSGRADQICKFLMSWDEAAAESKSVMKLVGGDL